MKKYKVIVDRTYTTTIEVEANGIDELWETINQPNSDQKQRCQEIWDQIYEEELKQMDVDQGEAYIAEIK
tara:strand:+ start:5421 stop:5630 length:210 start_codon:yes stop_codon:yes gene_type:complete